MKLIRRLLVLSRRGEEDLKRAVLATILLQVISTSSFIVGIGLIFCLTEDMGKENSGIIPLIGAFAIGIIFSLFEACIRRRQYDCTNIPAYRECQRMRLEVIERLNRIPYSFFGKRQITDIVASLVDDCIYAEQLISSLIPMAFAYCITVPTAFIIAFILDARMGIASVITVVVGILVQASSLRYQEKLIFHQLKVKHEAEEQLREYVFGMEQIRSDSRNGLERIKIRRTINDLKKSSLKMELTSGVFTSASEVLLQMGIGLVVLTAMLIMSKDGISVWIPVLFFAFALRIYIPVAELITVLPSLVYEKNASNKRIKEILAQTPLHGDDRPEFKSCDIEFEHVDFSYTDRPVLKDISFTAKTGNVTALVGESGSGKTTIANLIARLWEPAKGSIRIDGRDISIIQPEWYLSHITCVFQDVILFHDTILNNIWIGKPEATEEEVRHAAAVACCDEFIECLPEGINTVLTENGVSLSGGERQRLSIARAILKNAPVVILDEATAALDTGNEYLIHQAISNLCAGKTVIVIAHTLRNIKNADEIIVLDHGKICERGCHSELMELNGKYANMYEMQKKSLLWEVCGEATT